MNSWAVMGGGLLLGAIVCLIGADLPGQASFLTRLANLAGGLLLVLGAGCLATAWWTAQRGRSLDPYALTAQLAPW